MPPRCPARIAATLSSVKLFEPRRILLRVSRSLFGRLKSQRVIPGSLGCFGERREARWKDRGPAVVSGPRAIRAHVALLSLPLPGVGGGGGGGVISLRCLHRRCSSSRIFVWGDNFHCHLTRVRCYYRRGCARGKKLSVSPPPTHPPQLE